MYANCSPQVLVTIPALSCTPARPPQISLSLYSGKADPTVKEDGAFWTSFMTSFKAARGTPVATITHVSDMSRLTDEVRTSIWPPLLRAYRQSQRPA